MSKISFSEKMNDTLYKKIKSFLYLDHDNFFEYDEYFELALCIAYLTLSKEKIIKKDIKNKDRLGRLDKKVENSEFDKLFEAEFCETPPNIISSKETDSGWILDNIRDCIMHGAFDVDEERRCFIINNHKHDRDLVAEIPFSWFIAYAKYDILSKKVSNHYSFGGFYYNIERKDSNCSKTKNEVFKNIMYKVDISGSKFNVDEISKKIRNIMNETSKKTLSDDLINKYKDTFSHKYFYSERYLASFAVACKIAKETIEEEYPGVVVNFKLMDKKHEFATYADKHLTPYYNNYDVLMKEFDYAKRRKSYELISYIQKMLTSLETPERCFIGYAFNKMSNETLIQFVDRFDGLIGDDLRYSDNKNRFKSVSTLILNILINIYGITTLVVNHGDFYNEEFLNMMPHDLGIQSRTKQPIIEYENLQRNFLEQILDIEILLCELKEEYAISPSKRKEKSIKKIEAKLEDKKQKMSVPKPQSIIYDKVGYQKETEDLYKNLDIFMSHFQKTNDIDAKRRIREVILKLYDKKVECEIKYTSAISFDMEETLTIMRNCFSHIGRIYVGKNYGLDTTLIMKDYDTNNNESGCVILKLGTLIEILRKPFDSEKKESLCKSSL